MLAPPVDIYETDDHEVVIKAELPDMKKEDIRLTFENDVLTLRASGSRKTRRARSAPARRAAPRQRSRARSRCPRRSMPRITAAYKDGVLTVRLPQREEAKPKQIAVNIA